jgi:hypothetical protein
VLKLGLTKHSQKTKKESPNSGDFYYLYKNIKIKTMEAVLKFDLSNPDDVMAHKRCVKALDLTFALWDIDQHLRWESKYKDNEMAEVIREKLREIMDEYALVFDDLME